jgi:uncharacterized short protein YbdD (DUF466 family)
MKIPTHLAPRFAYFCIKAYGFKAKKVSNPNGLFRLVRSNHVLWGVRDGEEILIHLKPAHPTKLISMEKDFKDYLKKAMPGNVL